MLNVENNNPSILHLDTQLATHVNLYNHTNNIEPHKLSNITSSHFVPVKTTCATFRLCYTKNFGGVKRRRMNVKHFSTAIHIRVKCLGWSTHPHHLYKRGQLYCICETLGKSGINRDLQVYNVKWTTCSQCRDCIILLFY